MSPPEPKDESVVTRQLDRPLPSTELDGHPTGFDRSARDVRRVKLTGGMQHTMRSHPVVYYIPDRHTPMDVVLACIRHFPEPFEDTAPQVVTTVLGNNHSSLAEAWKLLRDECDGDMDRMKWLAEAAVEGQSP